MVPHFLNDVLSDATLVALAALTGTIFYKRGH
nr:MAG TPA: apolipoprotein [Caudoviricetes sp.]